MKRYYFKAYFANGKTFSRKNIPQWEAEMLQIHFEQQMQDLRIWRIKYGPM